ncbi:MAG TPA: hypothetical protein VFV00_07915 [Acidimicrobiales bacterium]|nr:hypothetical protein [Acidimicrobiales bacterium]
MGRVGAPGSTSADRRDAEAPRREGSRLIVVLDTGGVDRLAPIDAKRRARLRALREHADDIVVPAAVLAEGVLTGHVGHDHHVRQLLALVDVADTTEAIGYSAGSLRQGAIAAGPQPAPSGVDAVVAAEADARAANEDVQIITSDDDDLELLASLATNAERLSVLAP